MEVTDKITAVQCEIVAGIATRYALECSGFGTPSGQKKNYLLRTRPDGPWGPTQPPVQYVPRLLPRSESARAWR
jgi:hypothetical protein